MNAYLCGSPNLLKLMSTVRFLMPRIDTSNIYDSVNVIYYFLILNDDRQNFIEFGMTDGILSDYRLATRQYQIPGYYDEIIAKLFPYVLDKVKENPYAEGVKIVFSKQNRPGNTYNDWDTTQPFEAIEGYELEV